MTIGSKDRQLSDILESLVMLDEKLRHWIAASTLVFNVGAGARDGPRISPYMPSIKLMCGYD
jgi:hypothetical protein